MQSSKIRNQGLLGKLINIKTQNIENIIIVTTESKKTRIRNILFFYLLTTIVG